MQQIAFQPDSFQNNTFQIDASKDKVDEGRNRLQATLISPPSGGSAQVRLPSG